MMTWQQLLLGKLAEEASEVAKIALKCQQFGLNEIRPGQRLTNAERLSAETNDFIASIRMLRNDGCFKYEGSEGAFQEKILKVLKFADLSRSLGMLEPDTVGHALKQNGEAKCGDCIFYTFGLTEEQRKESGLGGFCTFGAEAGEVTSLTVTGNCCDNFSLNNKPEGSTGATCADCIYFVGNSYCTVDEENTQATHAGNSCDQIMMKADYRGGDYGDDDAPEGMLSGEGVKMDVPCSVKCPKCTTENKVTEGKTEHSEFVCCHCRITFQYGILGGVFTVRTPEATELCGTCDHVKGLHVTGEPSNGHCIRRGCLCPRFLAVASKTRND